MTNKELAEVMGVSASMASRVRNGKRLPSTPVLMRIHERMGISLETLLAAHTKGMSEFGSLISQHAGKGE